VAKSIDKWQFGDFQTPAELSRKVVHVLKSNHNVDPDVIIEPTCGKGSFIVAALDAFPKASLKGFDVNPNYVKTARAAIPNSSDKCITISQGDFFSVDWAQVLAQHSGILLVLGNPPWVTSSELGIINSKNLPEKTNFQGRRGIEAITGSGNFDISEWMLLRHVDWLASREGTIALLCKFAVARKVMRQIRQNNKCRLFGHIYIINAKRYFSASVEACLFVLTTDHSNADCEVYHSLESEKPAYVIGERDGYVVKNTVKYEKYRQLRGQDPAYIWRSGMKHDCSKVMELKISGKGYHNGFNEYVEMEQKFLYPLLKSSDVANARVKTSEHMIIVTQTFVGEDTEHIKNAAPMTWNYLQRHASKLDARKSSIYRNKPPYSIFGVGSYTFLNWKIAISSLYKKLSFRLIGPLVNRPVVFDDTVNFLSFYSEEEAKFFFQLLTSQAAQDFLESMIFWDEKRPITTAILRRMSLMELARQLGQLHKYRRFVEMNTEDSTGQLGLGIAEQSGCYGEIPNT
jgi:hypothetical protein